MTKPIPPAGLALAALLSLASAQTPELEKPIRLKAGEAWIDTGAHIAHAGPLVIDIDGDGKHDLLVGNFRGHIQVYGNTGTNSGPVLEDRGLLQADGKDIRIHNW
jgi:hypothetical protein